MSDDKRIVAFIESGEIDKVVGGTIKAWIRDHPRLSDLRDPLAASLSKRLRGALRGRVREILEIAPPKTYDPYVAHCPTCCCGREAVQRAEKRVNSKTVPAVADEEET
jgi:hypothetical protein